MKKIILLFVIGLLAVLTGCTDPVEDPIGCQEGEMQIGEECIVLSGPEWQLFNSINNSKHLYEYDMDISISNELESIDLAINVDADQTSIMIGLDRVITYIDNGDTCDVVEVYMEVEEAYTEDCNESEKYTFFSDLRYTWFTLEAGKYQLQEEYFDEVESLFGGFLASATINNFSTSVQDGYISEILLDIEINSVEYSVEMSISNAKYLVNVFTDETGGEE